MHIYTPVTTSRETLPAHYFFIHATSTTEVYTLSLHDALPICRPRQPRPDRGDRRRGAAPPEPLHLADLPRLRVHPAGRRQVDRKSTRLNSSHMSISYAVFCLKKKR